MGNKGKSKMKTDMSDPDLFIEFISPNGKGTVRYATYPPTVEQLTIVGIATTEEIDPTNLLALFGKVNALFDFLEDILVNPAEINDIKVRLRKRPEVDALTIEEVMNGFEAYVSEQSAFPTQEPSGSSDGVTKTGGRSTGRIQPGE